MFEYINGFTHLKIIVIPIGSSGDVHPLLGLALKLRERGHEILFITNGHFEPLVRKAGLNFAELGTAEHYHRAISDPDIWHPVNGTRKVLEWSMAELLKPSYELIEKNYVRGETLVVAAALCLGARLAHEKLGVPLVTTQLQPLAIYSRKAPARYAGMPAWTPPWLAALMFRLGEKSVVNPILLPPLNRFRAELGLPPQKGGIFTEYINSPQLVLGLFPKWFAGPPPDWPAQVRMPGFPLYDEKGVTRVDPALDAFLNEGTPPIAFTPGSAMLQGLPFFSAAARACEKIGRRGLLLTRYPENIPPALPPGVKHFAFAPFSEILPRCAALVHHGGIGTMAQAFAAGIPQLIMPMAHDQFDNAARVERLGAGLSIPRGKFQEPHVAAKLRSLLDTPSYKQQAGILAKKIATATPPPLEAAANEVEKLARSLGLLRSAAASTQLGVAKKD